MTLIECFTKAHMDNIISALRLRPRRVIFIGNESEMSEPKKDYETLLKKRVPNILVDTRDTADKDIYQLSGLIWDLLQPQEEYVIDLTGGNEPVLLAVGGVLARLDADKRKTIKIQRYDCVNSRLTDCVTGQITAEKPVKLTVEELLALHGGCLRTDSYQPPRDARASDLDELWTYISAEPKAWNRAQTILNEFESRSVTDHRSDLHIRIPMDQARSTIRDYAAKKETLDEILEALKSMGIIHMRSDARFLEYTYRSVLLKYCIQKAGNMLEVKTLLEGRAFLENGAPCFSDCVMSVDIDWDGDIDGYYKGTHNEIDVVFMRGCMPLFVSCKNGDIGEDELYKLHTVATRFGGPYVRVMLVAADIEGEGPKALRDRTKDMGITLVTDVDKMTAKDWRAKFREAIR